MTIGGPLPSVLSLSINYDVPSLLTGSMVAFCKVFRRVLLNSLITSVLDYETLPFPLGGGTEEVLEGSRGT